MVVEGTVEGVVENMIAYHSLHVSIVDRLIIFFDRCWKKFGKPDASSSSSSGMMTISREDYDRLTKLHETPTTLLAHSSHDALITCIFNLNSYLI